jgi:hypothetical protein
MSPTTGIETTHPPPVTALPIFRCRPLVVRSPSEQTCPRLRRLLAKRRPAARLPSPRRATAGTATTARLAAGVRASGAPEPGRPRLASGRCPRGTALAFIVGASHRPSRCAAPATRLGDRSLRSRSAALDGLPPPRSRRPLPGRTRRQPPREEGTPPGGRVKTTQGPVLARFGLSRAVPGDRAATRSRGQTCQ